MGMRLMYSDAEERIQFDSHALNFHVWGSLGMRLVLEY